MRTPEIIATDNGFAIVTAKGTDAVSLDEINAVVAYKLDEITTDLVCCDIVTGVGDGEQIRTIYEELPGFDSAMARLKALPAFNQMWRDELILPPFATNRTTLYRRTGNVA
jgi:adenylosuccinate synthase